MATYNGNGCYIDIDGTQVDTYFREFSLEPTIETVDATAGSSTAHRERNVGLKDHTATLTIVYDDAAASTLLPLVKPGVHTITFGSEGNATGKPKHVQSFIITGTPHTISVEKALVLLEASMEAAATPSTDMFAGGVWA
jgi:hypothetical protein